MSLFQYRASTLGIQLEETLQELLKEGVIDLELSDFIRKHFDKAMMYVLNKWVKDKPTIKGKLKHYQNLDNVWSFYILSPEIRVSNHSLPVSISEPLKIVACENKIVSEFKLEKKNEK
ncbi:transcription initiation factor IIA gamma chain (nucleomorph) [Chroomonas mesostigmatica CCMP1168]|uniref:Transcription initiation factor IIA subunit 2 n=1 Tax=Chroomonas mesostigmatica CCMP1168 TaxID=1195612 RepID=J7GB79_9CRYP|nr:transcription initiation factor IIA gamma chain [Chroomonas mesostigmatica CCMP1168]